MKGMARHSYREGSAVIVGFGLGLALCAACGNLAIGLGLGVGLGAVIDGWLRVQAAQRARKQIWVTVGINAERRYNKRRCD